MLQFKVSTTLYQSEHEKNLTLTESGFLVLTPAEAEGLLLPMAEHGSLASAPLCQKKSQTVGELHLFASLHGSGIHVFPTACSKTGR